MRCDSLFLPVLAGLLVGCGSIVPDPHAIVGRVVVTTESANGQASDFFDVAMQPFTPPAGPCVGATSVVGACCFWGPTPPPPLQQIGSGTPPPATENSAGEIWVVDTTTGSAIGTFSPSNGGYAGLPATLAAGTWNPGDELTVSADGDQIGAFTIRGPALEPPSTAILPATIALGHDLVVTWAPSPASDTMSISLSTGLSTAMVECTVPEAQGTVTIDASLFASFEAGVACQIGATREVQTFVQTASGRVELRSFGSTGGTCTFQ